jgi:hypothetical protein
MIGLVLICCMTKLDCWGNVRVGLGLKLLGLSIMTSIKLQELHVPVGSYSSIIL